MKKIKNKKSIVAIVAVLVVVVGVTLAFFTTTFSFTNLFGIGTYEVVTHDVFESPDEWLPGDTVPKRVYATNNGTIDAAVRIKLEEIWKDKNNDVIDSEDVPEDAVIINFVNSNLWIDGGDGYYYYKYFLASTKSSPDLFSSVTLNENLAETVCDNDQENTCVSNILGLNGSHYTLKVTIETVQADKYASIWDTDVSIEERMVIYNLSCGKTLDTLAYGDMVCLHGDTDECFNYLKTENGNLVLLAVSNLNISDTNVDDNFEKGVQSINSVGSCYRNGGRLSLNYGLSSFAAMNYWDDNCSIPYYVDPDPIEVMSSKNKNVIASKSKINNGYKIRKLSLQSKYGNNYPSYVYDTNPTVEVEKDGETYNYPVPSISRYVENYKNILSDYGAVISEARILTYDEVTASGTNCSGYSAYNEEYDTTVHFGLCTGDSFLLNTSYWLGTATSEYGVYAVNSKGAIYENSYTNYGDYGVRPVIVIPKSSMKHIVSTCIAPENEENYISYCDGAPDEISDEGLASATEYFVDDYEPVSEGDAYNNFFYYYDYDNSSYYEDYGGAAR